MNKTATEVLAMQRDMDRKLTVRPKITPEMVREFHLRCTPYMKQIMEIEGMRMHSYTVHPDGSMTIGPGKLSPVLEDIVKHCQMVIGELSASMFGGGNV
jgi:hypothetical protein